MLACPECRKLYPSDAAECTAHRRALVPLELLPDEEDAIEPGTTVGEYRVERRLGAGTFGAVYAGEQPLIGKKVAIKVLHRKFASSTSVVSRFIAEARAVNRIRHRNIIDIFSFGMIDEKQPYFVMELLEGKTLGELLHEKGRLGVAEAIPILRGIAEGLDAAHEAGVTHRDLKPDNIFLAAERGGGYFPKILDFGVAKLVTDDMAHKTATGAAIGTPSYMAPEQCRGRLVDHRADIYALGVVIHEMLTGQRLFQADSAMDVLFKHVSEPPRPMSEVCPDLPKDLDDPVLAMVAKDPRNRPDSAGAAVAALAARTAEGGAAPSEKPRPPARREDPTFVPDGVTNGVTDGARAAVATASTSADGPAIHGTTTMDTSGLTATSVDAANVPGEATSAPILPAPVTTADGRFAMSSKGTTIKVWDLRTGRAVHTFPALAGPDQGEASTATAAPVTAASSAASRSSAPPMRAPVDAKLRSGRARWWAYLGLGAAILAAFALWQLAHLAQRGRPSPSPPAAPSGLSP